MKNSEEKPMIPAGVLPRWIKILNELVKEAKFES